MRKTLIALGVGLAAAIPIAFAQGYLPPTGGFFTLASAYLYTVFQVIIFILMIYEVFKIIGSIKIGGGEGRGDGGGDGKSLGDRIRGIGAGIADVKDAFGTIQGDRNQGQKINAIKTEEEKLVTWAVNAERRVVELLQQADQSLTALGNILATEFTKPSRDLNKVMQEANGLFTQIIGILSTCQKN
jgi:hypothetical protein